VISFYRYEQTLASDQHFEKDLYQSLHIRLGIVLVARKLAFLTFDLRLNGSTACNGLAFSFERAKPRLF
jgi:hypothetical protein